MFKSLKRGNLSSYSKYQVGVTATRIEDSTLLNSGGFISMLKKAGNSTIAAITVLMILMVMLLGSITSAPKANAWGVDSLTEPLIQTICSTGATGLQADDKNSFAPQPAPNGTNPTMFEKYGMSGTTYTLWGGFYDAKDSITGNKGQGLGTSASIITATGGDSKSSGLNDWESKLDGTQSGLNNIKHECFPGQVGYTTVTNSIANVILSVTKTVVWVGNFSYESATSVSSSLYNYLDKPLTKISKTLWEKLFFDYLAPVVMISALWLFYVGAVKRGATKFWQSLIYMIAVVMAAGISYGNPLGLSVFISNTTTSISQGLTSGLSSLTTDGSGLCDATGKNASIRKFQCNNYYSNVYTPFVVGQFGASPKQLTNEKEDNFSTYVGTTTANKKFDLGTLKDTSGNQMKFQNVKLGNKTPAEQNFALYYIDHRSNWDNASYQQKVNKTRSQMGVIAHELGDENYNRDFRGDNSGQRVIAALVAALSAVMTNLIIIIISITIVVIDLTMLLMGIVLPVFALVALHPGQGRQKAIGYLNDLITMGIQKIALSLFLGVFIVIIQTIQLAVGNEINLGIQIVILVALGIVGFKNKKKFANAWGSWKIPNGDATAGFAGHENGTGGITRALWNRAKASTAGALSASTGGKAMGNKAEAVNKVKSAMGGAGGKPQIKQEQESSRNKKDSSAGKAPQNTVNDDSSTAQQTGGSEYDNSGSGNAPQHKEKSDETSPETPTFERSEYENIEGGDADNSGSGNAPQAGSESNDDESAPVLSSRQRSRNAKIEARVQASAVKQELKANGYRNRVGIGTILGAATKAGAIGLLTGNTSRAISAGTATVNRKKEAIQQRNAEIVKNVAQKHRDRNYEEARQRRQSEFEKAQEKRKAEREANQKRFAEERANRAKARGSYGQQSNNTQQESKGKAPQQPKNEASSLKVSKPANETQAPSAPQPVRDEKVEAPRVTTPAPQPVRDEKVNTPRQSAPPVADKPRQSAPPVADKPRQSAPQVNTPRQSAPPVADKPRQSAPQVNTPRQSAPPVADKPRQSAPPVADKPSQSAPQVNTPRQSAPPVPPAPKPVREPVREPAKQEKPEVSKPATPKAPAPPAPKAKVNPPKVTAPQPPLPSRRSLRESGNQTPPAPRPPQARNR